ncbi:MAG: glycosyltransferase family 39 protein [Patulibacter minatonensis]
MTWIVLVALVVHIGTLIGNSALLTNWDSDTYTMMAAGDAGDGAAPPGYPFFMRLVHGVWGSVDVLLLVQHLLLIAAGVALYRAIRIFGGGRGVASVSAAAFMLCGQSLAIGQLVMTEALFLALMAFVILALARLVRSLSLRDAAVLGLLLGVSATVRALGVPLLMLLCAGVFVLVLFLEQDRWIGRARRGVLLTGLMVVSSVVGIAAVAVLGGTKEGLPVVGKSNSGWAMYGRVAQFADCPATYVRPGLRNLCPKEPEAARYGPDYWRGIGGPALARFTWPPNGNPELSEFASAVIAHQPLDYLKATFVDTMRFFVPNFGRERPYSGRGWEEFDLSFRLDEPTTRHHEEVLESYYSPFTPRDHYLQAVTRYQEAFTLAPGIWTLLMLASLASPFLVTGARARLICLMLVGSALALLVLATAFNMYVARYALPAMPFLLACASLAVQGLAARIVRATPEPAPDPARRPGPDPEPEPA